MAGARGCQARGTLRRVPSSWLRLARRFEWGWLPLHSRAPRACSFCAGLELSEGMRHVSRRRRRRGLDMHIGMGMARMLRGIHASTRTPADKPSAPALEECRVEVRGKRRRGDDGVGDVCCTSARSVRNPAEARGAAQVHVTHDDRVNWDINCGCGPATTAKANAKGLRDGALYARV